MTGSSRRPFRLLGLTALSALFALACGSSNGGSAQSGSSGSSRWSVPVPLNTNATTDVGEDFRVQLTTDGAGIWVAVWESNDDLGGTIGTDSDILFSRSLDDGLTWTDPAALNTNAASDTGFDGLVELTTDGAGIWVAVWESNDDLGGTIGTDDDILFSRSTDGGATWSPPAALNTTAASDNPPAATRNLPDLAPQLTTDGAVWIAVWESGNPLGAPGIGVDLDILLARSTDGGATWSAPVPLNTNAATDRGLITGPVNNRCVDAAGNFNTQKCDQDYAAQLTTDGAGNWVAVWVSTIDLGGLDLVKTDPDILVARSSNAGVTWSDPETLNTNADRDSKDDYTPQLTTDGAGNWVAVWTSYDSLDFTIAFDADLLTAVSTDNGVTWSDPVPLNTNASTDVGDDFRPQITTDGTEWVAVWESYENLGGVLLTDA
ncbi:MAG: glycoside hydrolase, partial [Myxococcales bacterium]|nr:glycoside hydrolase [Myxococcales bacterium]